MLKMRLKFFHFQYIITVFKNEEGQAISLALSVLTALIEILSLVASSYEWYTIKKLIQNKIPFDGHDEVCECNECPNYREGYQAI